jgi:hypothetical protein
MISFSAYELLAAVGCLMAALFIGRAVRTKACCFLPFEPITVVFYSGLISGKILMDHLGISDPIVAVCLICAATGYVVGYPLGSFSHRGVVELSIDKKVVLKAYNIAYYYSAEEKSYCIQEQTFKAVLLRFLFGVHHTMSFDFDRIQSRTQISVNNNYFELKVDGAMTYILIKEPKTVKRGRHTFNADHYRFIPADITEKGPYDFFLRTELYLAAMDIADRAKAKELEADIRAKKSAAEGGATILESICKMEPEDAAATLNQLKVFVSEEGKTVTDAEAKAQEPEAKVPELVKRRWPWSRRKDA